MPAPEKRNASRIPADIPVTLNIDGEWRHVTLLDISHTGVKLRMALEALGLPDDAGLSAIARHLGSVLPDRAPAQFHPALLGTLVSRRLGIVRLGLHAGLSPAVELGCLLDEPLSNVEAAALGLAVPAPGESPQEAHIKRRTDEPRVRQPVPRNVTPAPAPAVPPRADLPSKRVAVPAPGPKPRIGGGRPPRKRLRVLVAPSRRRDIDPVVTLAETLDPLGVTVRVRDTMALDLPDSDQDVRPLVTAFCDLFGPEAVLEFQEGSEHLWTGPVSIEEVEVLAGPPQELLVGFAFGRELGEAEQRALGVED